MLMSWSARARGTLWTSPKRSIVRYPWKRAKKPVCANSFGWSKVDGACAVCLRPVEGNRLLADSYFYPIYDEAQKLDMAIAIHIANGNAWLNDLYGNHPVRIATTFHRFRIPTVGAFSDIVMS